MRAPYLRMIHAATVVVACLAAAPAAAGTLSVIYQANPDPAVDGTTHFLNPIAVSGGGVIVEPVGGNLILLLTPAGRGKPYNRKVIHAFADGCSVDGGGANGFFKADKAGNVWGATNPSCGQPNGTLFELVKPASPGGSWTYKQVLAFPQLAASQGSSNAYNEMVFDPAGNLYGWFFDRYSDCAGGHSCTVLYKVPAALLAGGSGSVVALLNTEVTDLLPNGLVRDSKGNFYTTEYPSAEPYGKVFQFSPPARRGGAWQVNAIHQFCSILDQYDSCVDGYGPTGAPAVDAHGVLYGTTEYGGAYQTTLGFPYGNSGSGVVWSLTPPATAGGSWTFAVLTTLYGAAFNSDRQNVSTGPDSPIYDTLLSKAGQPITVLQTGSYYTASSTEAAFRSGAVLEGSSIRNDSFGNDNLLAGPVVPDTRLSQDAQGNLYGGAEQYHVANGVPGDTPGVIYKITP